MKRLLAAIVAVLLLATAGQAAVIATYDPEPDPYYDSYSDPETTWSWDFTGKYQTVSSAVMTLYFKDGDF